MRKASLSGLSFVSGTATFLQSQEVIADKTVAVVGDRIILKPDILNAIPGAALTDVEVAAKLTGTF